ncbi:hypothetical protein [Mycolicibacterium holsaticum]|uniref:Uncharacterized protein n=1 Tax=Mycolicibacterium holsaticum TaxID=152142 RepID=A0A1E3RV03_9MYCO|nr:hypothetical protein [Mycolicibacterium holsaticum]MDA4106326.1 hypothetical protein [Mycolicibacterium holsaticum DSM 44478 = JCM 12374]ODQ93197.1 hypothetical protein BHQ17_14065 [Mycolicibacterium holsaticum]QZA13361.1 hypothetical protein K3U96_04075 [Mycolicibacterium holsaticum DSM 44478 = JCM 12374]UNC09171.1 hypothetical protein H5U41_22755 [Mycolicibacterium holsaticum DSM 44478 = JCM 12374]
MKKFVILGSGPVFAAAVGGAVLMGAGVASADDDPDVVGKKYSDATKEIKSSGGTAVVASRVGDRLSQSSCIVTNAWDASFLRNGRTDKSEVMVSLNCNGDYATATNPGASIQNPLGREAKSADEAKAQKEEFNELSVPSTPGG